MKFKLSTGVLSLVLGIAYFINALTIRKASIGNPMAPKVFPIVLGLLMIIFSLVLIFREVKENRNYKISGNLDKNGKMILYTSLSCILYALVFNKLGYVLSTVLFLEIILSLFNGVKNYKVNTMVSLAFSVVIYFVFSNLLGIILPTMPFLNI